MLVLDIPKIWHWKKLNSCNINTRKLTIKNNKNKNIIALRRAADYMEATLHSTRSHVVRNMTSIDVIAVNLHIQLLLILLETSKPFVTVWNVKPTIQSSLKGTKHTISSSGRELRNRRGVQQKQQRILVWKY